MSTPYTGSKISLISKSEIRYEGILYAVDPVESTIALAKVRTFGTEDRATEHPTSPKDKVFEYIIFKATDIKDIVGCETSQPVPGLPYDSATVSASTTSQQESAHARFLTKPESFKDQTTNWNSNKWRYQGKQFDDSGLTSSSATILKTPSSQRTPSCSTSSHPFFPFPTAQEAIDVGSSSMSSSIPIDQQRNIVNVLQPKLVHPGVLPPSPSVPSTSTVPKPSQFQIPPSPISAPVVPSSAKLIIPPLFPVISANERFRYHPPAVQSIVELPPPVVTQIPHMLTVPAVDMGHTRYRRTVPDDNILRCDKEINPYRPLEISSIAMGVYNPEHRHIIHADLIRFINGSIYSFHQVWRLYRQAPQFTVNNGISGQGWNLFSYDFFQNQFGELTKRLKKPSRNLAAEEICYIQETFRLLFDEMLDAPVGAPPPFLPFNQPNLDIKGKRLKSPECTTEGKRQRYLHYYRDYEESQPSTSHGRMHTSYGSSSYRQQCSLSGHQSRSRRLSLGSKY